MKAAALPLLAVLAAACCAAPENPRPDPLEILTEAPSGAAPGTCWSKLVTPALIQTVTDQVLTEASEKPGDDTAPAPATYRTGTHQIIEREREDIWFETPCPADLPPDFTASLQRALKARGLYSGAVTGQMDARTRAAVRRYQMPLGLDSGILSIAAARKLGLVPVELPEA